MNRRRHWIGFLAGATIVAVSLTACFDDNTDFYDPNKIKNLFATPDPTYTPDLSDPNGSGITDKNIDEGITIYSQKWPDASELASLLPEFSYGKFYNCTYNKKKFAISYSNLCADDVLAYADRISDLDIFKGARPSLNDSNTFNIRMISYSITDVDGKYTCNITYMFDTVNITFEMNTPIVTPLPASDADMTAAPSPTTAVVSPTVAPTFAPLSPNAEAMKESILARVPADSYLRNVRLPFIRDEIDILSGFNPQKDDVYIFNMIESADSKIPSITISDVKKYADELRLSGFNENVKESDKTSAYNFSALNKELNVNVSISFLKGLVAVKFSPNTEQKTN